ncbi:hypothetical protein [Candidatus Cyanaurora vandensis]|uniref:hypothetical protein n=1 Tax=Candidatus Cyanaurora vandensis TaxID=2714958 RepID=UPI00257A15C4|nr:hypothetical protein [Candidatus Cyanaurora vandensis]
MKEDSYDLTLLKQQISRLATQRAGDLPALRELLYCLEEAFVLVRDGVYMNALPDNRHDLFEVLQEMEDNQSWPILPRVQVQHLLAHLKDPP